jgi:hypothetical protein
MSNLFAFRNACVFIMHSILTETLNYFSSAGDGQVVFPTKAVEQNIY